jgi:hypothetical protein
VPAAFEADSSVKQFLPERAAPALLPMGIVVVAVVVVMLWLTMTKPFARIWDRRDASQSRCAISFSLNGALDYFVQLASIKPNTSTRRTVVDLDTLTFRHYQRYGFADGAKHHRIP